ncbi:MAG: Lrp/AsnC family transcriptional regulator [Opitutales bacterium]
MPTLALPRFGLPPLGQGRIVPGFSMDEVLKLLREGEPLTTGQMARILGVPEVEVEARLDELRSEGTLLGFRPVLNPQAQADVVRAVIEVKIAPEREGGFDRIAERIAKFDQVESCFLMSGTYDLLVRVRSTGLQGIASFVYEKLAPIAGVQATATHFMLKPYKESGYLIEHPKEEDAKPSVSP